MTPHVTFIGLVGLLAGCTPPLPYPGRIDETPSRTNQVVDQGGDAVSGFDVSVYRCTNPGSELDKEFTFDVVPGSTFMLRAQSRLGLKLAGGAFVAPDFYVSYEPKPYWVACISKPGYASRSWSIDQSQGDPVVIQLLKIDHQGPDLCRPIGECSPCRSYEYAFYGTRRYEHSACSEAPAS